MKYLVFISCFIANLLIAQNVIDSASELQPKQNETKNFITYVEFNGGLALLDDKYLPTAFPGASYLIGRQLHIGEHGLIDAEIGLAFPSIVTGKIGLGLRGELFGITAGIRPFPLHFYIQPQLYTKKIGSFIMSLEVSPYAFELQNNAYGDIKYGDYSLWSKGMITFGYRWEIGGH
jgi:hypothetical protein